MFTTAMLKRWNAAHLLDDALLIVAELVTNAINAVGIDVTNASWTDLQGIVTINLRILGFSECIRIEVWDPEEKPPITANASPEDEHGRGLKIVDALASSCGWHESGGGKTVWATLPVRHPRQRQAVEPKHLAARPRTHARELPTFPRRM